MTIISSRLIFLFTLVSLFCTQTTFALSFFRFKKTNNFEKKYAYTEEKKEFNFTSDGTLHVENENNKEQDTDNVNPNNITIESHDKDVLELFIKTENNDGDLECLSSHIKIDEKNAFIKTIYETKGCKASRSYTLKVPKKTLIKLLLTTKGSINAENIDNSIEEARSISGDVAISTIQGKVTIKNTSGNNTCSDVRGIINITSSSGNNNINNVKGIANIDSTSGDNTCTNVEGIVNIASSSGNNKVNNVEGIANIGSTSGDNICTNVEGYVTLHSTSGDNTAQAITGNTTNTITMVSTSGTNKSSDIQIPVIINSTSGDVILDLTKEEVTVATISGTITLKLGDYQNASIEASTNSGRCKSDSPVDGTQEKKKIKGKLGKGGPLKKLKTQSGNINIQK